MALLPLCLAGALLFHAQADPARRLHADEAFFLSFARNAAVGGDWWLLGDLDKPPLTIYANALALALFAVTQDAQGVNQLNVYHGEFVGRLFGVWSALLACALVYALSLKLSSASWRGLGALIAATLFAGSPYTLVLGASAFMDMPMLALGLAAVLAASHGRGAWAGVWLVLAFSAKPQGLLFAPVVLVGLWWAVPAVQRYQRLGRCGLAGALGVVLLVLWDGVRAGESVFALGAANNLSVSLNWYPRYALPAVPFVLMAAGLGGAWLIVRWRERFWRRASFGLVMVLALGWAARAPYDDALNVAIESDWRRHDPIDVLAQQVDALPLASVIYDQHLGWEMRYYLGQWTNKRRVHYGTCARFAELAFSLPERGTRYYLMPQGARYETEREDCFARLGKAWDKQLFSQVGHYRLYALTPP